MKEILKKIEEVHESLVQKEGIANQRLLDLDRREADIRQREMRNTEYESAMAVLQIAETRRKEADIEIGRVQEERIKFDNWMRKERAALASETARLQPLQDQEKQLARDREALYAREEALAVEKKEFKVRYIEKIKAHFANTSGAPNPDEIT